MFDVGTQELIIIFIVALLVFGPKRLPELARALGRGMREIKSAMRGVKETFEEAETEVSKEAREVKAGIEEHLIKGSPVSSDGEDEKKEKVDTGTGQNTPETVEEENKERAETEKDG